MKKDYIEKLIKSNLHSHTSEQELCNGINKLSLSKNNTFGPYLAGLLEADGTIHVGIEDKPRVVFSICFNKSDLELAYKLKEITQCGHIYYYSKDNFGKWTMGAQTDIIKIITLINGYMRTPKIEALHRAINYYNNKNQNLNIPLLNLDKSEINSNSWFAGFTDADGNFTISLRMNNNQSKPKYIDIFYSLELRQMYHRTVIEDIGGPSYLPILSKIGEYLGVPVYNRSRMRKETETFSYTVKAANKDSKAKIVSYFEDYPLFSSKYLNFKEWLKVYKLQNRPYNILDIWEECVNIKKDYNSSRTTYNWDHLDKFYKS